jgi:D-amino-acid oxidase
MTALGVGLSVCAGRTGAPAAPAARAPGMRQRFAPVKVAEDRVIRSVVGLRPYRRAGVRVEAEKVGEKLVVHNYGHGGGGITLSWGTSELAVAEAWKTGERRFAVLGCGAVGLATARLLQQRGAEVTIYAKDLPPHTTSNIAGGQWCPTSVMDADRRTSASDRWLEQAARLSHRAYQQLPAGEFGIRWLPNYICSDEPLAEWWEQALTRDLYPDRAELRGDEHPFPFRYARRFTTMLIETPIYLPAMVREVRLAGGRIVVRELQDRQQIQGLPEPVVVNCTGLGAQTLFEDALMEPVRGQLSFLLPQPEVDYIMIAGGLYMFPRRDGILLGGTFEHGASSLDVNEETKARILAGHRRIFEGLREG